MRLGVIEGGEGRHLLVLHSSLVLLDLLSCLSLLVLHPFVIRLPTGKSTHQVSSKFAQGMNEIAHLLGRGGEVVPRGDQCQERCECLVVSSE